MVRYEVDLDNLPPLTEAQKAHLAALAELPDESIDYSDIPPLSDDAFKTAVRGRFYRRSNPGPKTVQNMHVKNLNHVNIQTRDMAGTLRFYADLLGLEARLAPGRDPSLRQWLYDSRGVAVIHLNLFGTDNTIPRDVQPGAPTGAIHHVAFECEGFEELLERLKARGLNYGFNEIHEIGLKQLFVNDPNNVLLELNFRS